MIKENDLFKRIKAGDDAALDELVRLYYPDILRYCLWHTADRQSAEDAVQETFLKTIRGIEGYIHQGKFKAYLYRIASNICTDQWRKKNCEPLTDDFSYIENRFGEIESDMDIYQMLKPLPDTFREIVILRFVHELKIREISDIVEEPMRTVQSRLRAALKILKNEIQKGGV